MQAQCRPRWTELLLWARVLGAGDMKTDNTGDPVSKGRHAQFIVPVTGVITEQNTGLGGSRGGVPKPRGTAGKGFFEEVVPEPPSKGWGSQVKKGCRTF